MTCLFTEYSAFTALPLKLVPCVDASPMESVDNDFLQNIRILVFYEGLFPSKELEKLVCGEAWYLKTWVDVSWLPLGRCFSMWQLFLSQTLYLIPLSYIAPQFILSLQLSNDSDCCLHSHLILLANQWSWVFRIFKLFLFICQSLCSLSQVCASLLSFFSFSPIGSMISMWIFPTSS